MSETLKERLENLRMFLCELANTEFNGTISEEEIVSQANYHIATMDNLIEILKTGGKNMNFTKGEWTAYKDTLTRQCYHIEIKHKPNEKVNTEVAYVYHEIDKNLVASAPEMYEALKALINSLSQGGLDSYDLNEAKLAIMKAEGRTL